VTRAAALLRWYRGRTRDIPWRGDDDAYRVLVGEVMAQQTQATRAADHYRRFVAAYPTAQSLAAAPLAEVLSLWAGLGYNSRAKRLRDAAVIITAGGWPDDLEELPGVGPYTAAAVGCFALGAKIPVVDTNVRRVLGRWRGTVIAGDGLDEAAALLEPPAADWNQAVMDLGAEICTGQRPLCGECPVARWCAGPDAYQAPRRQSPYEGSHRQARSAVLLHLASTGPATHRELAAATGVSEEGLGRALNALVTDSLVAEDARSRYAVVD
jgi:A/G-specific adenine glycosylase